MWSSGLHRLELEEVGEILSRLHFQWDVATGGSPLRPGSLLVLPQAIGMTPAEATAVTRFLEAGGKVLVLGEARAAGPGGRMLPPFLPEAKVGRAKATRSGQGSLVALAPLVPAPSGGSNRPGSVGRAGRAGTRVAPRTWAACGAGGLAHAARRVGLASIETTRRSRVVARGRPGSRSHAGDLVRVLRHGETRAFPRSGGIDEKVALVPSAGEVAAVLPEFLSYGVLSLVP